MRALVALLLCFAVLPLAGCAKKTASEQLRDDMKKMSKDAKDAFNDL
jgi:hypothetical protein